MWSSYRRTFGGAVRSVGYDLSVRRDRARVYEQVLREGTEEDVRRFIDVDELIDLWDELVIPRHVRRAWADWLEDHRGINVSC